MSENQSATAARFTPEGTPVPDLARPERSSGARREIPRIAVPWEPEATSGPPAVSGSPALTPERVKAPVTQVLRNTEANPQGETYPASEAKEKTRIKKLALFFLLLIPCVAKSQTVVPFSDITLSSSGQPIGRGSIAVCSNPGLTTIAAQMVTPNIAVLTMSSNPITAGFAANQAIVVSGFTGADTYFNGGTVSSTGISRGFTILSVTSTQITYLLSHASASATSNGSVFQVGTTAKACAPLASIFSDPAGASPITQPGFESDGSGNYQFYAASGPYWVEFYGSLLGLRLKPAWLAPATNVANTWTQPQAFTQTGVFTNTQSNQPYSFQLNSCNPQTEFHATQGGQNTTDALNGCVIVPSSATVFNSNAAAGYANCQSSSVFCIAVYGSARAGVAGAHNVGGNFVADDKGFAASVFALDLGVNIANSSSTGGGILIEGASSATSSFNPAIVVQGGGRFTELLHQGTSNVSSTPYTLNVDTVSPTSLTTAISGSTLNNYFRVWNAGQLTTESAWQNFGRGNFAYYLQSRNNTNAGAAYALLFNPLGGNVGINTGGTFPGQALDVTGNVRSSSGFISGSGSTPNLPLVQDCGTTSSCSHTNVANPQIVKGSAPLVSGSPSTVTITGISPAFTSSTSYVCTATDATTATNNLLKVANVSGSSFTITGPNTITDTVNFICVGN